MSERLRTSPRQRAVQQRSTATHGVGNDARAYMPQRVNMQQPPPPPPQPRADKDEELRRLKASTNPFLYLSSASSSLSSSGFSSPPDSTSPMDTGMSNAIHRHHLPDLAAAVVDMVNGHVTYPDTHPPQPETDQELSERSLSPDDEDDDGGDDGEGAGNVVTTPVAAAAKKLKATSKTPGSSAGRRPRSAVTKSAERRSVRKRVHPTSDDSTSFNNNYCDACRGIGRFVCCDACPRSFHFACLDPPLEVHEVPSENWYCNMCQSEMNPPPPPPGGLFQGLFRYLDLSNPVQFRLPKEIIQHFPGITTNSQGEYIDTNELKKEKIGKGGFAVEPDYTRLKTDKGQPILCFKCRLSALHGRIISCDYCPLHWHWDCLDPPLVTPPATSRKWMCPNHAQHVMPKIRKTKKPNYVDPPDPYAPNNGDIEIVSELEPEDEEVVINDVRYRIPETSIRTRFLEDVKRRRRGGSEASLAKTGDAATREGVENWLLSVSRFQSEISRYLETELGSSRESRYAVETNGIQALLEAAKRSDEREPAGAANHRPANGHTNGVGIAKGRSTSSSRSRFNVKLASPMSTIPAPTLTPTTLRTDDPDFQAFLAFKKFLKVHGESKMRDMLGIPPLEGGEKT